MARDREQRPPTAAEVRRLLQGLDATPHTLAIPALPAVASAAPPETVTAATQNLGPPVRGPGMDGRPGQTVIRDPSLAVLPFRNAGQATEEHWADGFTDDLIETLSLTPRLRVHSRGAVMPFKGQGRDPREIGRELDVQVVVEGSVRRQGEGLRVMIRAVSVADGFQLWAKRFDRPATELLTIADDAAEAIAEALLKHANCPKRAPAKDPEALDLYLRARQEHHRYSYPSARRAAELLSQALALCPDEPAMLAGHSLACARMWLLGPENDGGAHAAALWSARRAQELAPHCGEAHLALASIRMQELLIHEGIEELRAAMTQAPLLAEAHEHLGRLLLETGALQEGMAALNRACELEPALTAPRRELARAHALLGDIPAGFRVLEEIEASGNQGAVAGRGRLLVWMNKLEEARAVFYGSTNPTVMSLREVVFEGKPYERALPGVVGPRRARRMLFYQQLRCEVLTTGGQLDLALEVLEQADFDGLFDATWLALCPALDRLRGNSRFEAVRAHVEPRAADLRGRLLPLCHATL
jgi:serine/threonine-protein kinase